MSNRSPFNEVPTEATIINRRNAICAKGPRPSGEISGQGAAIKGLPLQRSRNSSGRILRQGNSGAKLSSAVLNDHDVM